MTDYGIDVSKWNDIHDWNAVRGNNITFASVKATQGDYYTSPTLDGQFDGAHNAGVVAGAYHFADPNQPVDRNVARFVAQATGLGAFQPGAFLPMLDVENSPNDNIHWNIALANSFIPAFIRQLRDATGSAPVAVYASLSVWETMLRPDEWADDQVFLWLALYNGDPGNVNGYSHPRAALHQHTNRGHVPGVNGFVDRNVTLGGHTAQSLIIGNVAPPPAPPVPPTPPPTPGGWTDYRIRPGDTLSEIAAARGTSSDELARVNSIANPDRIYAGQVIRVPAGTGGASSRHYRIEPGDTLSGIAAKVGSSVSDIARANGIANPDRIFAGQWIDIP